MVWDELPNKFFKVQLLGAFVEVAFSLRLLDKLVPLVYLSLAHRTPLSFEVVHVILVLLDVLLEVAQAEVAARLGLLAAVVFAGARGLLHARLLLGARLAVLLRFQLHWRSCRVETNARVVSFGGRVIHSYFSHFRCGANVSNNSI